MNDRQRARGRSRLAAARKSRSVLVNAGRRVRRKARLHKFFSRSIQSSGSILMILA